MDNRCQCGVGIEALGFPVRAHSGLLSCFDQLMQHSSMIVAVALSHLPSSFTFFVFCLMGLMSLQCSFQTRHQQFQQLLIRRCLSLVFSSFWQIPLAFWMACEHCACRHPKCWKSRRLQWSHYRSGPCFYDLYKSSVKSSIRFRISNILLKDGILTCPS